MTYDYAFHVMLEEELTNEEMAKIEHDIILRLNDIGYDDVAMCWCEREVIEEEVDK